MNSVRMVQPMVINVYIPIKAYKSAFYGLEVIYRRRDKAPYIRTRVIAIIQRNSIANRHGCSIRLGYKGTKVAPPVLRHA